MSVISGETIERLIESGELIVEPLDKECLQPASIDLRVGVRVMKSPFLKEQGKVVDLAEEKKTEILPGQFAAVLTLERLSLPNNICGRMGLRSSYARKGLISFHGTQVDPGFNGRLVVPLINMGPEPVILSYGQPFGTLELNYLKTASSKPYSGVYQNQIDFSSEDIKFITRASMVSRPEILELIQDITKFRSEIPQLIQDVGELREMLARKRPRFMSFISYSLFGFFALVSFICWRFFEPWTAMASLGVALALLIAGIMFHIESLGKK